MVGKDAHPHYSMVAAGVPAGPFRSPGSMPLPGVYLHPAINGRAPRQSLGTREGAGKMDWGTFDALFNLLFGGALVIGALFCLVKPRNILGMVLCLFGASAVTAPAVLDLMGLITREWVGLSRDIVLGMGLIWTSIWALYSPPSPSFPRWTQWAWLVIGVGSVLWGSIHVLDYYWR
jgi:hypothetical protein